MKRMLPVLFAGLGLAAVLSLACGKKQEQPQPLRPVRYQTVSLGSEGQLMSFSGTAQAGLQSRLSFRVPGTVQAVEGKVGDQVRAGQLIAWLEAEDYRLQVQQAEASLNQARAQLRNAEANYERVSQLYENKNASMNALDQARTGYESARAASEAAEKQLELAQRRLEYTRLVAPVAGAIADVRIEAGENVSAGMLVAVLSAGSRIEVSVQVPENLIQQVKEGSPVSVAFDAIEGERLDATVTEVGVSSVGIATTFPVTVRLNENHPSVRPGMAAEVSISFDDPGAAERIVVPLQAVAEDNNGRFVYVVTADGDGTGVVHRRAVTTGELTEYGLEITEGLSAGEKVVTAGVSRIEDGIKVKLPEQAG